MKVVNIKSIYYSTMNYKFIHEKEYKKIIYMLLKFMMKELLNGSLLKLPFKLGTLEIVGKKQNPKIKNGKIVGLAPNWKATKELWLKDKKAKQRKQLVYHINEDSNQIIYRFFWSKKNSVVRNKILYTFIPSRRNKRVLAKNIKNHKEYRII